MTTFPTPDLLTSIQMKSRQSLLKSQLAVASLELSSGEKGSAAISASGEISQLFGIEQKLETLNADVEILKVAGGKANLVQLGLEKISEGLTSFAEKGFSILPTANAGSIAKVARYAKEALAVSMSALNVKFGRHAVFAGAAVAENAVAPVDALLADISSIVAGASDATSVIAQIDTYFMSSGGGFETNIYRGAPQAAPPSVLMDGQAYETSLRADSDETREALRSLALGFAAGSPSGSLGLIARSRLLEEASIAAVQANKDIVDVRGGIGSTEEAIEQSMAFTRSLKVSTELERSNIRSVEPFEVATRIEALQLQLESVYTLTSRLADLSLTKYLR